MKQRHKREFKEIVLPRPDTVRARCYSMIDIGLVDNSYNNEKKEAHKIMVFFEFPDLKAVFSEEKGEQPFSVMQEFVFSTDDRSNFSKFISNWRNKPLTKAEQLDFDPAILVGKVALISFNHKIKKDYANEKIDKVTNKHAYLRINGISPLPSAMKDGFPAMLNPKIVWDWDKINSADDLRANIETWNAIPNFIRDKVKTSDEFKSLNIPTDFDQEGDSDDSNGHSQGQSEPEDDGFGDDTPTTTQQSQPAQQPSQDSHAGPADDDNWGDV